jgi:hypothetical protein
MKKILRQAGYLQRLYRDARSAEHTINYLLQHVLVQLYHPQEEIGASS